MDEGKTTRKKEKKKFYKIWLCSWISGNWNTCLVLKLLKSYILLSFQSLNCKTSDFIWYSSSRRFMQESNLLRYQIWLHGVQPEFALKYGFAPFSSKDLKKEFESFNLKFIVHNLHNSNVLFRKDILLSLI